MKSVRLGILLLLFSLPGVASTGAAVPPSPGASPPGEAAAATASSPGVVTVYIVRHGEKSKDDPRDPSLSSEGRDRARELARLLADEPLHALFATPLKRTRHTLAPLAEARGLLVTTMATTSEQVKALLALPDGSSAVVAGHSNTVPTLIEALGGKVSGTVAGRSGPQLSDDTYDRLFVLLLRRHQSEPHLRFLRLLELRYGQP